MTTTAPRHDGAERLALRATRAIAGHAAADLKSEHQAVMILAVANLLVTLSIT